MSSAVDRLADRLEHIAEREAAKGGVHAKIANELVDDAAFLRKLKPRLMVARAKGEAPTDEKPGEPRRAPGGPQLATPRQPRGSGGRNPWLAVGIALLAGILVAKAIDWRGHAHPRD